jgi:aspartyl/asparaginyl beta-hydroxylase (cupin superfamily)
MALCAGEMFAFNHSYLHAAGNGGDPQRVVLALSVFHPELTATERQVIARFMPLFEQQLQHPNA